MMQAQGNMLIAEHEWKRVSNLGCNIVSDINQRFGGCGSSLGESFYWFLPPSLF
jgi:hypothetical protein